MKLNSIKLITVTLSCTALLFTGCKKGDEYYINPNTPQDATVQSLLPALEVATINSYESDLSRTSSLLVQYHAGVMGQATQANVYSLSESLFDNQWGQLYHAINTGNILVKKAGTSPRYRGIAKVVMALNWGILTDLWGDVPYTEAASYPNEQFPRYDSQEKILDSIQTLLSAAIIDLQTAAADNIFIPGTDDIIFGGNADAWIRTAWTLKARYLNRLCNKPGYNPAAILDALSKGIMNNSQDCMAKHGTGAGDNNQWWVFQGRNGLYRAAKPFVDSIGLRPGDLRLSKYFVPISGTVVGTPLNAPTTGASLWGSYLAGTADSPFPLVTNFEALFIKAEVLARSEDVTAADTLNKAIRASCSKVTGGAFDGSAIATYAPGNTNLGRVMYEKWIAMFGQCEAYSDYRRTGLPALTPNPVSVTEGHVIPKRFPTPAAERISNPNAPVPSVLAPVWWAE